MTQITITTGITDEHLQLVYADSRIQRIGHDHRPAAPVIHPLAQYLSAWVDGAFVGAFLSIRALSTEIEIHALLLSQAIHESRKLGRLVLAWAFEQPGILRVTGLVIDGLDSALNYCRKVGMTYEGRKRHVCLINGKPTDIHITGMTLQDWNRS